MKSPYLVQVLIRPAPLWKSVMVHVAGDVAEYEAEWSEVVHPHRTLVFFLGSRIWPRNHLKLVQMIGFSWPYINHIS